MFLSKTKFERLSFSRSFWTKKCMRVATDYFLFTTLYSNTLNSNISVTTVLKGGLYSMRCLEVLSSVVGCFNLPLSKSGQLVQQWVASTSFWGGDGWWAARVIGRESSEASVKYEKERKNTVETKMGVNLVIFRKSKQ